MGCPIELKSTWLCLYCLHFAFVGICLSGHGHMGHIWPKWPYGPYMAHMAMATGQNNMPVMGIQGKSRQIQTQLSSMGHPNKKLWLFYGLKPKLHCKNGYFLPKVQTPEGIELQRF